MISVWKLLFGSIAAVWLAGCDASGAGSSLSFVESGEDAPNLAIPQADLAGGKVVVSGPDGYCVDTSTLRSTTGGGFAAIASCNILSGGETGPVVEPVLLTVTVNRARGDVPAPEALAIALDTELLRASELSAVTVGQMATGGETAFEGSDARHWRGAFVIDNRLIGLALYAPKDSPLVGAQGAAFINTVSSRIRANSADADRSAEQSQTATEPLETRLSRLFGDDDLQ